MKQIEPTRFISMAGGTCLKICCLIALIFVLDSSGYLTPAYSDDDGCTEEKEVTAEEYWFWEGFSGIREVSQTATRRQGRLEYPPQVCVSAQVKGLDDPLQRTRGYTRALNELFKWIPEDPEEWDKEEQWIRARKRIQILIGHDFRSLKEWARWWEDNGDFLIWSEDMNRLVVDEAAKIARRPAVAPEARYKLSAQRYWFYEAMGWFRDVREENGTVFGEAWTGDGVIKFRLLASDLESRDSKEAGYRDAVRKRIERYLPTLTGEGLDELMVKLRELTGEPFQKRGEWMRWWNENSERLVLSSDGQRLIVKGRNGADEETTE